MEASAVAIFLLFAIIQERIEVWIFVGSAHLCIVAACFFEGFLIDTFVLCFLEFNFVIAVGMDSFGDVDSIEVVVIVLFALE